MLPPKAQPPQRSLSNSILIANASREYGFSTLFQTFHSGSLARLQTSLFHGRAISVYGKLIAVRPLESTHHLLGWPWLDKRKPLAASSGLSRIINKSGSRWAA
jgi:hypothetical protein